MSQRAIWNRVLHWSFTAILTTSCVFSARYMQMAAGELDDVSRQRRQALRSLRATQNELEERRGRYGPGSDSLRDDLQSALSDPAIELLFPGLRPAPHPTHAGLLLQLFPEQKDGG